MNGRVAIVTGASSGIGKQIAKKLAQNGMIVIATARSADRIEVIQGGVADHMICH